MAAFAAEIFGAINMNAMKQGVIIGIFAALFLLQSVSQLLPMHDSVLTESAFQSDLSEMSLNLNAGMTHDMTSNQTEAYQSHSEMPEMSFSSHTDMPENCEIHCQSMAQDCAEIMCASLVYDAMVKSSFDTILTQSVNFYSLFDYLGFSASSLYRPPITTLS